MHVVLLSYSCSKKQTKEKELFFKAIIDNNLDKKLKIPDSLILYKPFSYSKNQLLSNTKLRVYSHIAASCGTCLESMKLWNEIIPEFNKQNVKVYLVCSSDDRFELLKYFFESKEFKNFSYELYLDYENDYVIRNKFMQESKNFETVLIDGLGKIKMIGNPIFTKKIKDIYMNLINKQ